MPLQIILGVQGFLCLGFCHFAAYALVRAFWRKVKGADSPSTERQRQRGSVIASCSVMFLTRLYLTQVIFGHLPGLSGALFAFLLLFYLYPECQLLISLSPSTMVQTVNETMTNAWVVTGVLALDTVCLGMVVYQITRKRQK